MKHLLNLALVLVTLLCSCSENNTAESDKVVAKAGDKFLYKSELKEIVPTGTQKEDSLRIVEKYTENWLKKHAILLEAKNEKNTNNEEIERKTEDYRNSLLIYEYQKKIFEDRLDTNVGIEEMNRFYSEHQKDFELKQNIVKGIVVISKGKAQGLEKLAKEVERMKNLERIKNAVNNYCSLYAAKCYLDYDLWQTFESLAKSTPFSKISNKTDWLVKNPYGLIYDGNYTYYVKIFDYKLENRISPPEYVKEQIKSIILNSRKLKILEEYENELYTKALSEKRIEKYTDN